MSFQEGSKWQEQQEEQAKRLSPWPKVKIINPFEPGKVSEDSKYPEFSINDDLRITNKGLDIKTPGHKASAEDDVKQEEQPIVIDTPVGEIDKYDNALDKSIAKLIQAVDEAEVALYDQIKQEADNRNYGEITLLVDRLDELSDIKSKTESWL
jgi:hypothetical protein